MGWRPLRQAPSPGLDVFHSDAGRPQPGIGERGGVRRLPGDVDAAGVRHTFGMGFGASVPLRLAIIGDYFGRRNYGSIVGLISSVNALFGAAGPVFVGLMFDVTDSYRPAFMVLFILPALAIPLTLTLERPGRVAARSRRSARASGRSE